MRKAVQNCLPNGIVRPIFPLPLKPFPTEARKRCGGSVKRPPLAGNGEQPHLQPHRLPVLLRQSCVARRNRLGQSVPGIGRRMAPHQNLPLTPECVLPGSEKKVWWRCSHGHVWRATIHSRTDGCGCPVCANRAVAPGVNDLASQFPRLAEEWHPTKMAH